MHKSILILLSMILALGAAVAARADGDLNITAGMIHFRYVTLDGSGDLPCTHVLANADSQDWNVTCQSDASSPARQYVVHLWVTTYSHPTAPKLSIETLYWITDLNVPSTTGRGSTSWYNFNEPSDLTEIDINQWLEDGDSELALTLNAGG